MLLNEQKPFAACSTPAGTSGIAVIRISGEGTSELLDGVIKIIRSSGDYKKFSMIPGYTAAYADFMDPDTGKSIDKVIITRFTAPHSYTGDDMAEISCHGSYAVKQEILRILGNIGIEAAAPGQFTRTAFMNGKLDLTQAEAVMDVIAADSTKALEAADTLMSGALAKQLQETEKDLYEAMALIEMVVEFPEHDDTPENDDKIKSITKKAKKSIEDLCNSYGKGRLLSERMKVALVGLPNSGKSTLLNTIAGYERAIVTEIAGTTRDTIDTDVNIDGIPVTLVDTAGIRETEDKVEAIGVERARKACTDADMVFYLVSPESDKDEILSQINEMASLRKGKETFVVFSKSDEGKNPMSDAIISIAKENGFNVVDQFSSVSGENMDILKNSIVDFYNRADGGANSQIILTNRRHYDRLSEALDKINLGLNVLEDGMGVEVCSSALRLALDEIGEITGKTVSSDLADTIFGRFCIGK